VRPILLKANRAATGDALNLIQDNQWLGWDFLLWLTTRRPIRLRNIHQPGRARREGETFVAYLNDRPVLLGEGEGVSRSKRSRFTGRIQRGTRCSEKWKANHRSNPVLRKRRKPVEDDPAISDVSLFFLQIPSIQIEKDNTVDEADEKEAAFYERMSLLEEGLQLFDSLYTTFLEKRLGKTWADEEKSIRKMACLRLKDSAYSSSVIFPLNSP